MPLFPLHFLYPSIPFSLSSFFSLSLYAFIYFSQYAFNAFSLSFSFYLLSVFIHFSFLMPLSPLFLFLFSLIRLFFQFSLASLSLSRLFLFHSLSLSANFCAFLSLFFYLSLLLFLSNSPVSMPFFLSVSFCFNTSSLCLCLSASIPSYLSFFSPQSFSCVRNYATSDPEANSKRKKLSRRRYSNDAHSNGTKNALAYSISSPSNVTYLLTKLYRFDQNIPLNPPS